MDDSTSNEILYEKFVFTGCYLRYMHHFLKIPVIGKLYLSHRKVDCFPENKVKY